MVFGAAMEFRTGPRFHWGGVYTLLLHSGYEMCWSRYQAGPPSIAAESRLLQTRLEDNRCRCCRSSSQHFVNHHFVHFFCISKDALVCLVLSSKVTWWGFHGWGLIYQFIYLFMIIIFFSSKDWKYIVKDLKNNIFFYFQNIIAVL